MSAYQATTANKPAVSAPSAGRLAMSFDGVNDFLQTGITTGNEGWMCAGVRFSGAAAVETIIHAGAEGATSKGAMLVRVGAALWMAIGNGAVRSIANKSDVPLQNTERVVDGGWTGSIVFCAVDGVETAPVARSGDATPPPVFMRIGAIGGSSVYSGPMSAIVYTPTLPSLSQRQLIRRWVGSLQGQTL